MKNCARRLARMEAHAREIAIAQNLVLPVVCFVDRDKKILSKLRWIEDEQAWTEFKDESRTNAGHDNISSALQ